MAAAAANEERVPLVGVVVVVGVDVRGSPGVGEEDGNELLVECRTT